MKTVNAIFYLNSVNSSLTEPLKNGIIKCKVNQVFVLIVWRRSDLGEEVPGAEPHQPGHTALIHRLQVLQRRERRRGNELLDGRVGCETTNTRRFII